MPSAGAKLRKAYVNLNYPFVVLRFEDGHEIRIAQGKVKTFDAYVGEVIKVVAIDEILEQSAWQQYAGKSTVVT